jgi:hypothetical protein
MPTGLQWGKANNNEFVEFERGFNGASQEQLLEAARRLREPGADFLDVFWRVFFGGTPDKMWDTARGNWFGIHPDPMKAGLPMWASNAVLTPPQVHAVIKEATARVAGWLAEHGPDTTKRRVELWCRCAVPEFQAWFLRPRNGDSDPTVAHLFIATPYNAGYTDAYEPGNRWSQLSSPRGGGTQARELVGALSALTALSGGDPVGDLLRAAERTSRAAKALLGESIPEDDNAIFKAICANLTDVSAVTRPPFKGTGLACRMSSVPATVADVAVSTRLYTAPPDDDADIRSELFNMRWTGRPHDGDHLRHVAALVETRR